MTPRSEILFISDLHLDPNEPEITQHFLHFLETRAAQARVLYILGDLFEVWLGDDDERPEFQPVFDALKKLSRRCELFFLHGNRDFLIGEAFANRVGMTLLQDPTIIELDGLRIGLMHGDLLCTDDVDYQNFRHMVRNPDWQQQFLAQPLPERRALAARLREQSTAAMAEKEYEIMDVNAHTVMQTFAELGVEVLIHGHTHRPGVHRLADNRQRIVLGDWCPNPSLLAWSEGKLSLLDPRC